ncbi:MAG: immune inhibitor A [Chloroflexi bacterium OHK40]
MSTRITRAALLAFLLTACTPFRADPPQPTPPPVIPTMAAQPAGDPTPIPIGAPTATPATVSTAPSPTPPVLPTAAPVADDPELAALDAAQRPLRDQVALARALGSCRAAPASCPTVARTTPLEVQVGEVRPFWVTDLSNNTQFEIQAELRYAGPVVLMYVQQGMSYDQQALERAARTFEQEIYPRTREIFGSETQPGVDGDTRITILNADDPSGQVLGYFSSQDSLPRQVNRFSNEREMFFMNISLLDFASPDYLDVLAHEFQHMIHQNEQPGSATWVNEGASQLSEDLNGYLDNGFVFFYLTDPDVQLNTWGNGPGESAAHYGAAHLFMRYIYAQYAGEEQLRPLIRADAGDNLQAFVELAARTRPDLTSFGQLVADWAVANLIDDPAIGDGRYTYATGHDLPNLLPVRIQPLEIAPETRNERVAQFGADYYRLPAGATVSFRGTTSVPIAAEPTRGRFSWWSGRSDDTYATLTRPVNLRGLSTATLQFATWYEIEDDYDYAFVSVSTDGGTTWQTLPGSRTTDFDPQGVNYGNGITGASGAPGTRLDAGARGVWIEEAMDLTPFAGQEILLRFWQINDQGFNAPGMLIDDIRIPELGFSDDVEGDAHGWQADGFVRVDGDLPQRWELRLVRGSGNNVTVEPLSVAPDGSAMASLAPGEEGTLVVVAATPHTTERARYELIVE